MGIPKPVMDNGGDCKQCIHLKKCVMASVGLDMNMMVTKLQDLDNKTKKCEVKEAKLEAKMQKLRNKKQGLEAKEAERLFELQNLDDDKTKKLKVKEEKLEGVEAKIQKWRNKKRELEAEEERLEAKKQYVMEKKLGLQIWKLEVEHHKDKSQSTYNKWLQFVKEFGFAIGAGLDGVAGDGGR